MEISNHANFKQYSQLFPHPRSAIWSIPVKLSAKGKPAEHLPRKKVEHRASDRQLLAAQAFRRLEVSGDVIDSYHQLLDSLPPSLKAPVEHLYLWFLCPLTLWPFNLHDLLLTIFDNLRSGKPINPKAKTLIELLPELPSETVLEAVIAHEHDIQRGHYERFNLASPAKFDPATEELLLNPEFKADWRKLREAFDIRLLADSKDIVRRTPTPERNLHQNFHLDTESSNELARAAFDTFCLKWNLYGMQGDTPLLQKVSVNLSPFGTMIFIPSYWSFDHRRDLDWKQITNLHRKRSPKRMGATLAEGRKARRRQFMKMLELTEEAKTLGLRGQKRIDFLLNGLGMDPRTDPKQLARLRKEFGRV